MVGALAVGGGFLRECLDGHDGESGAVRDCGYDTVSLGESFCCFAGYLAGDSDGCFGCLGVDQECDSGAGASAD